MATKILLKKSVTGGASPLTSDLDQGELAINLVDRKIYTKDSGNNIKEITGAYVDASAPSNPVEGDLWYDTANNLLKAHNGTGFVSAGYQNLSDLEDVTITSIASGELLKWNGSAFVNNTLAEADIQSVTGLETAVEGMLSVTDAGGDGSLAYANGVFTYTGPSASEVRAHITGGTGISVTAGEVALDFADAGFKTDNVVEGSTNLYYTDERVDDRVGALVVGGTNITATYDDTAGTLTIDQDASAGLDLSNNDTDDLAEGNTNQYYTDARAQAAISVTDAGGDGSLSISSGVITYTGPSAAEVRAHHTAGTGVAIASGQVSIGQAVGTTDDVVFGKVTTNTVEHTGTITLNPNSGGAANAGVVVIAGDLTVNGTTTTVNSNEVNIGDAIILLNSDETGSASQDAGIEIERGTDANVSFIWDESAEAWTLNDETLEGVVIDGGSY
jgi:hypothetical protein